MKFRSSLVLAAFLMTFAVLASAQSFPPTFPSYLGKNGANPFENAQNISFQRSPSIATDPSNTYLGLYMAYGSTCSCDNYLYVNWSSDGVNWSAQHFATGIDTNFSPAIAFYNGYLWVAYVASDGSLYLGYSHDPPAGFDVQPVQVGLSGYAFYPTSSPTLAVYNGQLWIAAIGAYQGSDDINTFTTTNGTSFFWAEYCSGINDPSGYVPQGNSQVGMVAFNNLMYYAYQTTQQTVRVCSTNGTGGSQSYSSEAGYSSGSGVSATIYNGYLTLTFKDDNGDNHQIVEGTNDGANWTGEEVAFSMNGNNEITPSAAAFNIGGTNYYYMIFTGNSGNHRMWTAVGN